MSFGSGTFRHVENKFFLTPKNVHILIGRCKGGAEGITPGKDFLRFFWIANADINGLTEGPRKVQKISKNNRTTLKKKCMIFFAMCFEKVSPKRMAMNIIQKKFNEIRLYFEIRAQKFRHGFQSIIEPEPKKFV